MKIDREELAWAAGFFDGEGYIGFYSQQGKPSVRISIGQVTISPLLRFSLIVPHGQIYNRRPKVKRYDLEIKRFEAVQAVIAFLWFKLSPPKRIQASQALKKFLDARLKRAEARRTRYSAITPASAQSGQGRQ